MGKEIEKGSGPNQNSSHNNPNLNVDSSIRKDVESVDKSFPVVGIGASAGGLEALRKLLECLPSETGFSFVIIQHLMPGQASMLSEILSRSTKMSVCQVDSATNVEPNNVYVIPPNKSMTISENVLELHSRLQVPKPIDSFLISLAKDRKAQSIGIILSGTGTDGTEGLKAIKAEAGITFAQKPETAQYPDMPESAIAAESAFFVLSPDKIAEELSRIAKNPQIFRTDMKTVDLQTERLEQQTVFSLLKAAFGVDFSHYKESTVNRRITRRMVINQINEVREYTEYLRTHHKELQALFDDMLIGVTNFFREPQTFAILGEKIFPNILSRSVKESIRIWIPGCSTGEEVYSMAIALEEFLESKEKTDVIAQIFGTDLNQKNIDKARQAIYGKSIEENVSPERLHRFFVRVNGNYQIKKSLRDMCIFAKQDLTKDPPFSNLDMICCRNVLIYFDSTLQEKIIPTFHYALKSNGFLVLGESESIGRFTDLFSPIEKKNSIFVKKGETPPIVFRFENFQAPPKTFAITAPDKKDNIKTLKEEVDRIVMSKYVPAMMLVNSNLDILIFRGYMGPYLLPESGAASLNINKMIRDELKAEIESGIYRAKKENKKITITSIEFKTNDDIKTVNIDIMPLRSPQSQETFYLVLLIEKKPKSLVANEHAEKISDTELSGKESQLKELREELESTKLSLQTIIEGQEGTNEELRAAMEEAQSSNEELQSTNEELETAKEELQSTNEELKTLNDELKNKNVELARSNDNLSNVIKNMDITMVIVDNNMRIRLFTPNAQETLGLIPPDISRLISNIRLSIPVNDLEKMIEESITKLSTAKTVVQDAKGRFYSLTIRPYITEEKKIDGAVISFIDIDEIKKVQNSVLKEAEKYRTLAENAPEIIARFDKNLQIIYVSPSVTAAIGVKPELMIGKKIGEIDALKSAVPPLTTSLTGAFNEKKLETGAFSLSYKGLFKEFKYTIAPEILENKVTSAVSIMSDITDVKKMERKLLEHSQHLEELVKEKTEELKKAERLAGIGETAGMIGHDIRNPLQTITSSVYLVKDELQNLTENETRNSITESINLIEQQTEYISKIVADLQDYARQLCPDIKEYRLIDLVENALSSAKIPKEIQVNVNVEKNLPKVKTDKTYFLRTLNNLITNSVQAMPKGGKLTIAACQNEKQVQLSVQDNGMGISESAKQKLFKPLFTTKAKGQGFGLAVCKRLMEAQDSKITFESQEGKGATFTIQLPT